VFQNTTFGHLGGLNFANLAACGHSYIIIWAVVASASSMKYKEESFAHYSMYRAVKEQYQHLVEITYVKSKPDAE